MYADGASVSAWRSAAYADDQAHPLEHRTSPIYTHRGQRFQPYTKKIPCISRLPTVTINDTAVLNSFNSLSITILGELRYCIARYVDSSIIEVNNSMLLLHAKCINLIK